MNLQNPSSSTIKQIFSLIAALCISVPPAVAAESSSPPPTLKLGLIVPLTGPLAEFGFAIQNGLTLATEDFPELSRLLHPLYEDSQYESAHAVSTYHRLRSVVGADLVYVFGGPMSETLAPLAEKHQFPLVSTEYSPTLTRGREYVLRFANTSYDFADTLLGQLRANGMKRFVIVKCENQYHNTLVDAFQARLQAGETVEIIANHLPGEQDFRTTISKLRTREFDALGIYLLPGMQNAFLRQIQRQQMKFPLFGTDTFETNSENAGVEQTVNGALYANAAVSEDFERRYRARFGNNSQLVHAAHAYEFARLLHDAFKHKSAPQSAGEIMQAVKAQQTRSGVLGSYTFEFDELVGQYFRFPLNVKRVEIQTVETR